eukprot:316214-Amphidinium_carterae.1
MKAHQTQAVVDPEVDELANQATAPHNPLDPDATWICCADFANKVYHVWRIVDPQLWVRPTASLVSGYRPRLPLKTLQIL